MTHRLGRKPAVHNRRTFRLGLALHQALATLPAPPASSDDYVSAVLRQSPQGWIDWWNTSLGDCVCEDSGHELMLHTANAGTIVVPSAQDILSLYETVGGYVQGNSSTDQGCDETAMCQYLVSTGLCGQKSAATGPLDPSNLDHLRWCVQIFGACRLGIIVDDAMISAFESKQPWEQPANPDDPNAGGHDVPIVRYDAQYAYVVTWGALQPVAWSLVANSAFLDEAHVSVDPDFVRAGGTTVAGFDLAQMLSDAQAIEAQEAA